MPRHRISGALAAGLALSALAGCASQHGPSSAPVKDFGWFLDQTPQEGAKLAYGEAETDNVTLMLICQPHSGLIEVSVSGDKAGQVQLVSRRVATRVLVRPPKGGDMEDLRVGEVRANDPALAAFANDGDLVLVDGGHRTPLPARPAERRLAGRFLAACRPA